MSHWQSCNPESKVARGWYRSWVEAGAGDKIWKLARVETWNLVWKVEVQIGQWNHAHVDILIRKKGGLRQLNRVWRRIPIFSWTRERLAKLKADLVVITWSSRRFITTGEVTQINMRWWLLDILLVILATRLIRVVIHIVN